MSPLRVEWADRSRLAEITPAWDELALGEPSPFMTPDAFMAWQRAFAREADVQVCTVWRGERLDGLLPLVREGQRLTAAANDHTQLLAVLARDGAALSAVFDAVLARRHEVELEPLSAPPTVAQALRRAAARAHCLVEFSPSIEAPFIDTSSGDMEAYRRATRPSWMKRLARYRRQMAGRHELELRVAQPPRDLAAELAAGWDVEARGWKGRAGTAIASSADTLQYYTELAEAAHARGELRLSALSLDGRLVAFDLAVERSDRLFSIKTGFNEDFSKLVPGLVLRLSLVEDCFARRLDRHEMLGASYDWKRNFATGEHGLRRVRIYPLRPAPLARWAWRTRVRPS